MTISSNYGLNLSLVSGLQSQQSALGILGQEISSGQKYNNLTDYNPTDAHTALDLQGTVTQRQSYIGSIQTVQARLSVYNSTMTDIEKITSQALTLASGSPSYDPSTADNIQQQATANLRQLTDDLNQTVAGRYIYAGTRYSTQPVVDLTSLTTAPTATTTTSPALPSYDTNFNNATSFMVNSTPTALGAFIMGNTAITWGQMENNGSGSVNYTVGGTSYSVAVPGLTFGSSPTVVAQNLALTLNAIAGTVNASSAGVPSTLTASSSSGTVTFNLGGAAPTSVTPDSGGAANEITWAGGLSGNTPQTPNSSTTAYTADTVQIDLSYSLTYGVNSNDPSFQKLVNGLRYMQAAVTAGKAGDNATYKADMTQAATLLSTALSGIQALHTQVASNQNVLTQEVSTQNADITSLQNQLSTIQKADLTTVGTEINLLQTQLEASYSATATLEKLTLVTYL